MLVKETVKIQWGKCFCIEAAFVKKALLAWFDKKIKS